MPLQGAHPHTQKSHIGTQFHGDTRTHKTKPTTILHGYPTSLNREASSLCRSDFAAQLPCLGLKLMMFASPHTKKVWVFLCSFALSFNATKIISKERPSSGKPGSSTPPVDEEYSDVWHGWRGKPLGCSESIGAMWQCVVMLLCPRKRLFLKDMLYLEMISMQS